MSNMSELWILISELWEEGFNASEIAAKLNVPLEWVNVVLEECDVGPTADEYADVDAMSYGNF